MPARSAVWSTRANACEQGTEGRPSRGLATGDILVVPSRRPLTPLQRACCASSSDTHKVLSYEQSRRPTRCMGCPCSHSCGPEILSRFDPATQRKMKFHPGSWLKWNPDDADVAGRSITNRTAFTAVTFGRSRKTSAHRRNAARPSSATLLRGVGTTNRYYGRHAEALSSNDLEDILEKTVVQVSLDDLEGAWSTRADGTGHVEAIRHRTAGRRDRDRPDPPAVRQRPVPMAGPVHRPARW